MDHKRKVLNNVVILELFHAVATGTFYIQIIQTDSLKLLGSKQLIYHEIVEIIMKRVARIIFKERRFIERKSFRSATT